MRRKMKKTGNQMKRRIAVLLAIGMVFGVFGISSAQPDVQQVTSGEETVQTAAPERSKAEESSLPVENAEGTAEQDMTANPEPQPEVSESAEPTAAPSAALPIEREGQEIQKETAATAEPQGRELAQAATESNEDPVVPPMPAYAPSVTAEVAYPQSGLTIDSQGADGESNYTVTISGSDVKVGAAFESSVGSYTDIVLKGILPEEGSYDLLQANDALSALKTIKNPDGSDKYPGIAYDRDIYHSYVQTRAGLAGSPDSRDLSLLIPSGTKNIVVIVTPEGKAPWTCTIQVNAVKYQTIPGWSTSPAEFRASGVPIVIKARTDGQAGAAIMWGNNRSVDFGPDVQVFGGKADASVSSSHIVMQSGTVASIYGGGLCHANYYTPKPANVDSAYIGISGGTVTNAVVGGSFLHGTVGTATIEMTGGTATVVQGGGLAYGQIGDQSYSSGTEEAPQDSQNRTNSVSITISGGAVQDVVYGGGQGYAYTGAAVVNLSGNAAVNALAGSGSNGYTGSAVLNIKGGTIQTVYGVNRGVIETIGMNVTDGLIDTLYAGGNTEAADVDGIFTSSEVQITGGLVGTLHPGSNGTAGTNVLPNDPRIKVSYKKSCVTNPNTQEFGASAEGETVAKVNGQGYATVQEAVNSAAAESIIEIISQEAVAEDLTIHKNLTITGQGADATILKGKITVYGCTAEFKNLKVENNTATAYGTALITFPAAQAAADVTFTDCTVYDNDTAFRLESAGSSLTLDNTDVTGAAHYGIGLRSLNQTLTVNGGSITGWGAVMTSAGSLPDGIADSGTKIEISGAKIAATEGASGGYYGAVVLQESYHGVTLHISNSEIVGEGLHTAALDIRAYGSTVTVENSILRANNLVYGKEDGETGQPEYYGPVTLSHNGTYEKVYTTAADGPRTKIVLDGATKIECKPANEGGTYPIIKRGQDTATIGGVTYDVVAGGSINEAIAAAEDGATLRIQAGTYTELVKPQAGDSQHVREKSITLLGANAENDPNGGAWADDGTILTGGMYLGYDDSHTRNCSITVKGLTFQDKGLTIADERDVHIENNKFTDITDTNAIAVLDQECGGMKGSVIVKNNRIVGVTHETGMGINLRNPYNAQVTGNYIENTNHNAILFQKNSRYDKHAGTVEITGNTVINWDADNDDSGGRALRIDTQGNGAGSDSGKQFTITGNSMQKADYDPAAAADPDFAKITGVGENAADLCKNYWNSDDPDFDTILTVCKAGSGAAGKATIYPYYADAALTRLVEDIGGVELHKTSTDLPVNKKEQLVARVTPGNAYNKGITWTSSDPSVATIDANGLLVPLKAGQTVVRAEAANGKFAQCAVRVIAPPAQEPVIPGTEETIQIIIEPTKGTDNRLAEEEIVEAIGHAAENEAIVVKITEEERGCAIVTASVLKEARQTAADGGAKIMVFEIRDENGKLISSMTIDVTKIPAGNDAAIDMGHTYEVSAELEAKARASVPDGAGVMFINLSHEGAFPCPVTRMDRVDANLFRPGDTVYLYWVNPQTGELSEEQKLTVDGNGYITYTISHASPYLVTGLRKGMSAGAPDHPVPGEENKTKAPPNPVPQTGDETNLPLYGLIAVLAAGALITAVKAGKRARQ